MASRLAEDVLGLIGGTPMLRLKSQEQPGHARLYAKAEFLNPGGSVKDRIALGMLQEAEARGQLKPGKGTVVEPTSGNTGLGLAMVCAVKGWRCLLLVPEGLPPRRIGLLKAYGAEVEQTPFELGMKGAVDRARELLEANPGWVGPMQFSNRANPMSHRKTTAQEIHRALKGRLDAFVAGVGTGGTLTGVGEFLKKKKPALRLVAVEPKASPVLSGGQAGAHRIQGIGAGFLPAVLDMGLVDEVIQVEDGQALATAAELARREGLLCGPSSGANVFAARQVAAGMPASKAVVTVLCDRGEIYLDDQGRME